MSPPTLFSDLPRIQVEVDLPAGSLVRTLRFGAEIDEHVDFGEVFKAVYALASPEKTVRIDLGRLRRINSRGARSWLQFIEGLQAVFRIEFSFVSEPMLELASMWPGVLGNPRGAVEFVELPYSCPKCHARVGQAIRLADVQKNGSKIKIPEFACPTCRTPMVADVFPDEYFGGLLP